MAQADVGSGETGTLDTAARIVVLAGGLISSLAIMAIASVLPQIDRDLARAPADHMLVKQLIGAVALAMVVGSSLAGFFVDRLGMRRVLVGAALLYALGGTAGLYLGDLRSLLFSRLLVGLGAAAIQITCITLVNTRLQGVARARWMGLHISVAMLTAIFAHPIAGALGEVSWRLPFALYGIGLLLIPAVLSMSDAGPRRRVAATAPGSGWSFRWFPLRYIPLAFAIGSLALMTAVQVPFVLRAKGMVSPSSIALVLTADSLAGALMAMFYGRARTFLSAHMAFAFSFAMAAIGLGLASVASGVAGVIVGLLVYGLGIGWFVPNLMTSLASRLPPEYQGRGAGIVKAAHFLSAPISIPLVEPIARSYGPAGTLMAAAILAAVCLVVTVARMLSRRAT